MASFNKYPTPRTSDVDAEAYPSNEIKIRDKVAANRSEISQWGDPAPLGLFAFSAVTFTEGIIHCGFINNNDAFMFGPCIAFGGMAQVIAGFIEFARGNSHAGVVFSSFGLFWISHALLIWPGLFHKAPTYSDAEYSHLSAVYTLCWGFLGIPLFLSFLGTTIAHLLTLFFTSTIFWVLCIHQFTQIEAWEKVTGYWMLIAGSCAYYTGTSLFLAANTSIKLPLGKYWSD